MECLMTARLRIHIFIDNLGIEDLLRTCSNKTFLGDTTEYTMEPHREKTGFLPRRKQRRRSASR